MESKKGQQLNLIVKFAVVAAVVFIIWIIVSGGTNKAFASVMNPVKKWLGFEVDEESEEVVEEPKKKKPEKKEVKIEKPEPEVKEEPKDEKIVREVKPEVIKEPEKEKPSIFERVKKPFIKK